MSDKQLSSDELAVWQRLQTVTESLRREVGRGLRADADLSESEFTVLAHVVTAGGSIRAGECARSIGWDSSRLAHQLGRLERRGLVDRTTDATDARSSVVSLTETGRAAHRRAVGPHLRAAQRWFAAALAPHQLQDLDLALRALESHVQHLSQEGPSS